ncbi:hypothetical protein BD779DRAFT_1478892 [Infundibulicybe gibba]|nr:hypothetical protein BD779DRAFT_1478892 [Infundibulicybe gibba]
MFFKALSLCALTLSGAACAAAQWELAPSQSGGFIMQNVAFGNFLTVGSDDLPAGVVATGTRDQATPFAVTSAGSGQFHDTAACGANQQTKCFAVCEPDLQELWRSSQAKGMNARLESSNAKGKLYYASYMRLYINRSYAGMRQYMRSESHRKRDLHAYEAISDRALVARCEDLLWTVPGSLELVTATTPDGKPVFTADTIVSVQPANGGQDQLWRFTRI